MVNHNVDILPQHTPTEVEALRDDLKINGLKVPVITDEAGEAIDGRLRVRLCEELKIDWRQTAKVEPGMTAEQKAALRIKLNVLRRSTPATAKQKRNFLDVILKAEPYLSNGAIAKLCGMDHSTVSKKRTKLEKAGAVKRVEVVTGSDRIARRRPARSKRPQSTREEVPQVAAETTTEAIQPPEPTTGDPGQPMPSIRLAETQEIEPVAEEATVKTPVGRLESSTFNLKLVQAVSAQNDSWEWIAEDEEGNAYHLTCRRVNAHPMPLSKVG